MSLRRTRSNLIIALLFAMASGANQPQPGRPIQLFNGQNLDNWYVFTTETGYDNPGVFQVVNEMIYVPGGKEDVAYFGGLITREAFENYRLRFEYKWGSQTYGSRKGRASDSGIMLHCMGKNGPGPWLTSYEFQVIEGGTGDLLVVNVEPKDNGEKKRLTCTVESEIRRDQRVFKSGAEPSRMDDGRLNWWGRDPDWKDDAGFRGRKDQESPLGEWTTCEIVADGDSLEYFVNGKLVNRARHLSVSKGQILLQTEGAEVWYRNIKLTPLEKRSQ